MGAYLDRVVLAKHELESVRFACIDGVCIKHLDIHQPTLGVVCLHKGYPRRKLALHLHRAVSTKDAVSEWEGEVVEAWIADLGAILTLVSS